MRTGKMKIDDRPFSLTKERFIRIKVGDIVEIVAEYHSTYDVKLLTGKHRGLQFKYSKESIELV